MNLFNRKPKNTVKPGSYLEKRDKLVGEIEKYDAELLCILNYKYGYNDDVELYTHCIIHTLDALKQDLLILDTKHELGLI